MSFNGTRSAATRGVNNDFELTTTPAKTPELWLEDKCESENFLFLDGQEVHIEGRSGIPRDYIYHKKKGKRKRGETRSEVDT